MEEKCKCCKKAPPAGYVPRYGIYLPNICLKCYKKHPEDNSSFQRNKRTIGMKLGGAQ